MLSKTRQSTLCPLHYLNYQKCAARTACTCTSTTYNVGRATVLLRNLESVARKSQTAADSFWQSVMNPLRDIQDLAE